MVRRVAMWCLVGVLSLVFVAIGVTKFTAPAWETRFLAWGYPSWARVAVGALEILGAILLWPPRTRRWAACALLAVMAGAALTHLVHGEAPRIVVNAVLAALLFAVVLAPFARSNRRQTFPPR
jgi:putative oxidoreductase